MIPSEDLDAMDHDELVGVAEKLFIPIDPEWDSARIRSRMIAHARHKIIR